MPDHSDGPLPEGACIIQAPFPADPTDEAEAIHAPFIAAYFDTLPRQPVMTDGAED